MFVGVVRRSLRFLAAMTFMAATLCSGHGPSVDIDQPAAARPVLVAQQTDTPVVAVQHTIPASVLVIEVHFGAPAPLPPSVPASAWLPAGGAEVSPHGQRAPPVL